MPDVNQKYINQRDVATLATAVVNHAFKRESQGAYRMDEYLNVCAFCGAKHPINTVFKHAVDCPVLIARYILPL